MGVGYLGVRCWVFGAGFYVLYRILFVILTVTRWGLGIGHGHWVSRTKCVGCWVLRFTFFVLGVGALRVGY